MSIVLNYIWSVINQQSEKNTPSQSETLLISHKNTLSILIEYFVVMYK